MLSQWVSLHICVARMFNDTPPCNPKIKCQAEFWMKFPTYFCINSVMFIYIIKQIQNSFEGKL